MTTEEKRTYADEIAEKAAGAVSLYESFTDPAHDYPPDLVERAKGLALHDLWFERFVATAAYEQAEAAIDELAAAKEKAEFNVRCKASPRSDCVACTSPCELKEE